MSILLNNIIKNLTIIYGSFSEELIEQTLSCKYLNENDIVLEIGGNMGRNALVISSILNNDKHLVTMEPNNNFNTKLIENKNINNKNFYIENSALSLIPIYFNGSLTFDKSNLDDKFPLSKDHLNKSNNSCLCDTLTYKELELKYNLQFNVLVIDCEGSFYYILKDMDYMLNNIKLIIMENDYENINHYIFIKNKLIDNNFTCIESIPLCGYPNNCPWNAPCKENFYEVWKK